MTELTQVFADLSRLQARAAAAVSEAVAGVGDLTLARYEVLRVVDELAPARVNDIADSLAMTWGGASKIVDKLETAALCNRRPNPTDGRSSLIELTARGQRQLRQAEERVGAALRDLLDGAVSDTALHQLSRTLHRLRIADPGGVQAAGTA